MEKLLDDGELARRFLLGDVSAPERAQIEDRFLASDDFHQELLIAEDDLIDAYARGELPATERARFEQHYLSSPTRRARLEFARTLHQTISATPPSVVPARTPGRAISPWRALFGGLFVRRPALGFTMAAAALLCVVLGGLWLFEEKAPPRPAPQIAQTLPPTTPAPTTTPAPPPTTTPTPTAPSASPAPPPLESPSPQIARAEKPSPSNPEKKAPVAANSEMPGRSTPVVATLTLLPGLARGESSAQLILPPAATEVRLRLGMEGETYEKYRATLSTPEGRKLWSRVVTHQRATQSGRLTLSVPAGLFKGGDYVLEIGGANAGGDWQSVADYAFRIHRK